MDTKQPRAYPDGMGAGSKAEVQSTFHPSCSHTSHTHQRPCIATQGGGADVRENSRDGREACGGRDPAQGCGLPQKRGQRCSRTYMTNNVPYLISHDYTQSWPGGVHLTSKPDEMATDVK